MRYGGGGVVFLISLIMGIIGFWRLWKENRIKTLAKFLILIILYPVTFSFIMKISDDHLRIWVAIPVIILFPAWILMGFFIYNASENSTFNKIKSEMDKSSESKRKIRFHGLIFCIIGFVLWLYGVTHPKMAKTTELIVLGGFMYLMLIGTYLLLTGKKLRDS